MPTLDRNLRSRLERTIREARVIAETAARAALGQLGVDEQTVPAHLAEPQRELRRRLRAHGRQLGDALNGDKVQNMDRLVEEVAYEHWHRMLFARFLAENNLLMYPDPDDPVAVTLEECEDLAADEGAANGWELAARFAARMLPQIFRLDSPVFQLALPPEHQQGLERLLAALPQEVFSASDSLGWVYQFWQADNKERINSAEVKIGARELPAVTQLFTEPYMVSFLLDNGLGAWWAARRLSAEDLKNAASEEELRQKAAIPGVPLEFLRFVKLDEGGWALAAGIFEDWPKTLAELKLLDPCCGSGHFLVAAFLMLVPMRRELESLTTEQAIDAVLRDNIHGLELDQRCVELAAFVLAFAAWTYCNPDPATTFGFDGSGFAGWDQGAWAERAGYRPLPALNLACSGLNVTADKALWTGLAKPNTRLRNALDLLYDEFQQAPVLGSLLNPSASIAARLVDMSELQPALQQSLQGEDGTEYEAAVAAQGLASAAALLSKQYTLVITNVPYLARGKQGDALREFCENHYPEAKNDLATVFLERCLGLCATRGTASIVLPQNWLFLTSYKKFREKLLKQQVWHMIARLGPKGFQTPMWDFNVQLITLSRGKASMPMGGLMGEKPKAHFLRGLDVAEAPTAQDKADGLRGEEVQSVEQAKQLENPDARVALGESESFTLLNKLADGLVGLQTGDDPMFTGTFWEIPNIDNRVWEFMQGTPEEYHTYAGQSWMVRWEQGRGLLLALPTSRPTQGLKALGKHGIAIHRMQRIVPYHYSQERFHQNVATIIPHNPAHLPAIWCFCSSPEYNISVRRIDQKLNVTNATLVKVPFDLDHWTAVAAEKYPHGLPKPYTDDPTQWIFHGHPCGSVVWDEYAKWTAHGPLRQDATVLHVAVTRLLGYRWPAELDENMELSEEQRQWVEGCEALLPHADADGIVCIPPVRGEAAAADRLLDLLVAAYGPEWTNATLATLLANADHAGKTLETWLREKFFTQHCKLFQHRPFIWHIWDGLRDGFSALVNYHKLDYKNLETLTYTYVGDWISRQKQDMQNGIDGAGERLAAAESLKKKLELILAGEAPHDIFVRWKALDRQPIGWNPDINDGVRLNIRPFLTVPDVGKKGAGILRDKPNIKWDKDRGKDVESAPWYHLFNGDRINDHHLTLAEKQAARGA
ncbi:Eco57I restriction-modification methylase domain-containing protein [Bilophila wadsworthia]|uniref:Eco57I restriction-modification methylase domain-containing protein n=1 Tax=Bilophila wadsworthia TaxID=35833 RepID=UPI00241F6C5D|nr:N-6 DNA methylase [Bilophila wadsworthia]